MVELQTIKEVSCANAAVIATIVSSIDPPAATSFEKVPKPPTENVDVSSGDVSVVEVKMSVVGNPESVEVQSSLKSAAEHVEAVNESGATPDSVINTAEHESVTPGSKQF